MWYKIDLTKFVVQLLPPILRSKFLVALLKVLVLPLSFVYDKLMGHRENVFDKLETSTNVIYLEKVLNETFFLSDRQIYITSLEEDFSNYWHFKSENAPSKFLDNSSGIILKYKGESNYKESFTVNVPTFLCTSLDSSKDKYQGKNLAKIKAILNIYKPAGRTYSIILYDYE